MKPTRRSAIAGLAVAAAAASRPRRARASYPGAVRISTSGHVQAGQVSVLGSGLVARIIDEGWLEAELGRRGVKLEWFPVMGDTGTITNEAFATGRIDFANYGDFPSVTLNAAGFRTSVVVPIGRGSDMFLLVPPNSPAQSIQDLRGKRVSVHRGRPWDLGFQKLLAANGLTEADFRIFNLNPNAGAAALAAGKVDAHFGLQGYTLVNKGIGRILWSTEGKPRHFKMRAELWGARRFTTAQPELTQVVATAYVKAAAWAADERNRETVIQIGTRNGTPEKVVRLSYADPTIPWADRWTPLYDDVVLDHYRDVVSFAWSRKLVPREVRAEELLEPRFATQALEDLGLQQRWKPWARQPAGGP